MKQHIGSVFAENLRRFRKLNGWNQERLAEESQLSFKYIYKLESGKANPSIKVVNMLAQTLGVSIYSFFKDENGNNIEFIKEL